MPIIRTPVAHKFGIISQTQKVELEKRIATRAYNETRRKLEAQNVSEQRPLPFEVTEEFVYKFNDCSPSEREKMQDTSMKMLKRLKKLAGLRKTSDGNHVDLARAWVDLALLSQCRCSKLEEACFMTLIASLDQAVASAKEILSLFYLAKSGIHWLKKETGNESVLRSNEILLIKMTFLVFLRLYCHHILQELKNYEDQKASLSKYLAGFHEKEKAFRQFPGANLSIQIITEAGRRICSDIDGVEDSRRQKDSENQVKSEKDTPHPKDSSSEKKEMKNDVEKKHSIFLCCSLYVWKVVHYDESSALNPALQSLLQCISQFHQEEWLDVILAFHILADACCKDKRVLEAFQCLISYDFSPSIPTSSHLCDTCYSSFSSNPNTIFFCKPSNATSSSDDKALQEPEDFDIKEDESNNEKEVINNAHQFSNNKVSTERIEETQAINKLASAQRFHNRRQYRWPWQMVYTFSECLMTICMYGACSDVKKSSLIGSVKRSKNVLGSGLIPLLNCRDDEDSWKVRYGVVKSLVRVCRYHGSDVSKDGLSNVAWLAVMENENTENDSRVLEAVKLARVEAEFEKRLDEDHVRSSLWATRMASALLPMLHKKFIDSPATVANPECSAALKSKDKGPKIKLHKSRVVLPNTRNRSDVDTTLRQEINLNHLHMKPRVDYISRQNNDLRGIIDDQWKKDLLHELEDEMKESIEQLEKKETMNFKIK